MRKHSTTTLNAPLRRMIRPTEGTQFVVTLFPEGWIEVRPRYGRAGSERRYDLKGAWSGQLRLPITNQEP